MSVSEFKKNINNLRQILVGKVTDPKEQIEQITYSLIYKYMSMIDNKSVSLGGKKSFFIKDLSKFDWENLFDQSLSGIERLNLYKKAIESFGESKNLPELFRKIFINAEIPFSNNNLHTFNLYINDINSLDIDKYESLGDLYEYLISFVGVQGDAAQFRTPRHLIEFIVSIVEPNEKDKILDPSCGTGGFLLAAFNYISKNLKNNKAKVVKNIMENMVGYDIGPDMVKMSLVNLYLHGFPNPKIYEYDTLTDDEKWSENFDVILANPPFMTPKGGIIPHNKFSISAKRSEILFVDYITSHLNKPYKGGIIVPDGVLHNNYKAYKEVRKNLINNNFLYCIAELPHGAFKPYASVKTHIMFFDSEISSKNDKILYLNVKKDGFTQTDARKSIDENDLPEIKDIILNYKKNNKINSSKNIEHFVVKKSKILESKKNTLIGRFYKVTDVNKKYKYKQVQLDNKLIEIKKGITPIEKSPAGKYNFIVTAKNARTTDHYDFSGSAVCIPIVSSTGHGHASIRRLHYVEGNFALANIMCALFVKDQKILLPKYLFYILSNKKDEILSRLMSGTSNVSLDPIDIHDIYIPLPKIEEQIKFVKKIEIIENEKNLFLNKVNKIDEDLINIASDFWN
jgi:type I restriction-modification system DNA methylase subunit